MIDLVLHGQLGNWLFQYAAARHLAMRRGTTLRLSACDRFKLRGGGFAWVRRTLEQLPLQASFTVVPPLAWRDERWLKRKSRQSFYVQPFPGYDAALLETPDGACLSGFFQSEKYFRDIATTIRRELVLPEPTHPDALRVRDRIVSSNAVSIHVRRTDYVTVGWSILDANYYARAIAHMRSSLADARFFVFSDDPSWCRANLRDVEVVDLPHALGNPLVDLRLMTACRHHIIANSTYSWWGAWLGTSSGTRVLAPSVWLPHLAHDARYLDDVLCPEWERFALTQ